MWWRSVIFAGLLFGSLLAILPHIVWLITILAGKIANFRVSYPPFGYVALGLVLLLWGLLAYGSLVGLWQVEISTQQYSSREVPKTFDGYKIVHISDLHVDTYDSNPGHLEDIIQRINDIKPDLVLFTGDMVTGGMESVYLHRDALRQLYASDGVMSILGNHDFFIYDRQITSHRARLAAADSLAKFEREQLGWKVLRNSHIPICRGKDSIYIAGVDNINGGQGFRTIQMGDLKQALSGIVSHHKKDNSAPFTILLSHDPSHWRGEVLPKSDVQITLSGHTHAAQIRLFGWSLASLFFDECDGRYDQDGRMLYVNAGIGCTAPVRLGCPAEITVITLTHTEK